MDVAVNHEMVICDQSLKEIRSVVERKVPGRLPDLEVFLAELSYELIPAVYHAEKLIRDATDQPILNAAIVYGIDVIVTGDKDFLSLDLKIPECLNAAEYMDKYSDGDR